MSPKLKFQEGEKVLCFHGPLIYEAKCLDAEVKDKQNQYYIHYAGWNKNWDEWVPESRVLKYTDANLQKQKELHRAHKANLLKNKKHKKSKESSDKDADTKASTPLQPEKVTPAKRAAPVATASSQDSSSDVPRKKRGRLDPSVETEEPFSTNVEVKIQIPDELKPWLVDDWEYVTVQKKLATLPAKPTVDQIINNYIEYKTSSRTNTPNKEATLLDVMKGITNFFNVMLGSQLLYKFERPQYAELLRAHPDTPMSQIYGGIHLLRLFVKLGSMLAYTPLGEKSTTLLLTQIQDLLRYLRRNTGLFSLQDYGIAPPEYHRKAL